MAFFWALLIGLGAGLLSGLLGIGGGTVIVPSLVFFLGIEQRTAQGISLLVIIPTAVAGAITHYRLGQVALRYALWMAPAAIIGTLGGSLAASSLRESLLRRGFALVLVYAGARLLLPTRDKRRAHGEPHPPASET